MSGSVTMSVRSRTNAALHRENIEFNQPTNQSNSQTKRTTRSHIARIVSGQTINPSLTQTTHDVGVQSQYRDAEAQTFPYSPDYITDDVPSTEASELIELSSVISFSTLNQSNDQSIIAPIVLPITQTELAVIDEMRARRAWEASLPSINQANGEARRKAMIEEREWREWSRREQQLALAQSARMNQLIKAVNQRQIALQQSNNQQLEIARSNQLVACAAEDEARERERRRLVRLLGKKRLASEVAASRLINQSTNQSVNQSKRDIVSDYVDYSSEVYAPLKMKGALGSHSQIVDFDIPAMKQSRQMEKIQSKHESILDRAIKTNEQSVNQTPPFSRASQAKLEALTLFTTNQSINQSDESSKRPNMNHSANQSINPSNNQSNKSINVYKQFAPLVRPPTPVLPASTQHDDQINQAALTLQRLFVGRAMQNRLWKLRAANKFLIAELREGTVHFNQPPRKTIKQSNNQTSHDDAPDEQSAPVNQSNDQSVDATLAWYESTAEQAIDCLVGGLISDSFVSLHANAIHEASQISITRLHEELLFIRRVRECEEAGRRQAEQQQRLERERYQSIMQSINQSIASSFVAAQQQIAIQLHEERAQSTNQTINQSNDQSVDQSTDDVIGSLLEAFVFPEVARRVESNEQIASDSALIDAAHAVTCQIMEAVRSHTNIG